MRRDTMEWTTQAVIHAEQERKELAHLGTKALGVVLKHFLVPLMETDLTAWRNNDHDRHHLAELEESAPDQVWIKPWIVGTWMDDQECVLHFTPGEFVEEVYREPLLAWLTHLTHPEKRSALLGIYLTVSRPGWSAVFGFRLDGGREAKNLGDLLVREALCLAVEGDPATVETWLEWAYRLET